MMKIDPEYYWYHMETPEIDAVIKGYVEEYRDGWEKTRIIAYNAASGFSKMPTITKFLPFTWDSETASNGGSGKEQQNTKRKPSKHIMDYIANNLKQKPDGKL